MGTVSVQLGEEPESVTAAERARWKAIESKDEEALLQANSELIAAMLHCQYGDVSLDAEKASVTIQVNCFPPSRHQESSGFQDSVAVASL